ncbi:MAG: site-specific integrase, partial [Candidatus Acidiferrales bacterium]
MIYKRGKFYWYKFLFNGKLVRESTKQGNDKVARTMESAHRTSLAKGEVGIREKKTVPTLTEFLKKEFLPFAETKHADKPATLRYYKTGAASLIPSLGTMRLDEINDQHAQQFAARHSHLSPSTINCGLRTLRRAIYLATEWGKLDRRPKITLAKGERQRERVLTDREIDAYLAACDQPWRDAATIMLGTGMRPGEVFALSWERVLLNGHGGLIQVAGGKSKAAKRLLPMLPAVYNTLKVRWEAQGQPESGWVFPSASTCGHLEGGTTKGQHSRALATLAKAHKAKSLECPEVKPFEPYCLRHTALTRLGASGCDTFTLARIAGHSSITITQRYVHPQADAIERAFARLAGHKIGHTRPDGSDSQSSLQIIAQNASRNGIDRSRQTASSASEFALTSHRGGGLTSMPRNTS